MAVQLRNGLKSALEVDVPLEQLIDMTIEQLAQTVIGKCGTKAKLTRLPLPQDDPMQRCPDISLAKQELDWAPTVDLDTGIGKTIEYFQSLDLSAPPSPI